MKIFCDTCFSPSHLFNFMEACSSWWVDLGGLTGRIEFTVEFWDISIMNVLHLPGECRQISLPRANILGPLNYPRLLNPVFKVTSGHTTREVQWVLLGGSLGKRIAALAAGTHDKIISSQPIHGVSPEQPLWEGVCQMDHRAQCWPKSGLSTCICVRQE